MIRLITNPADKRYIFIVGDPVHIAALEKHMNKIPTYQFTPTFNGVPDPSVFLDKFKNKQDVWVHYCPAGLWKEIFDFCNAKNIPIEHNITPEFKYTQFNMSQDEFAEYVRGWGMNINPYDYQLRAAWLILKYNFSLSELATRAGKTLIFTIVARTMIELMGARKVLMIVPSVHLVKQGVKDIDEYREYFNSEQIWAGGEQVDMSNLTIGTFQSLIKYADPRSKKYNPDFFNDYDVVCVDEAHRADCRSIKTILAVPAMKDIKLRFGFTGTLPKQNTIEWLSVQAILGPKINEITAHELVEAGFLADPIIKQFRIKYDPATIRQQFIACGEYLLANYKKSGGNKVLLPKDERVFTMIHDKTLPTAMKRMKKLTTPDEYYQYVLDQTKAASQTHVLEQMVTMFSQSRIQLMENIIKNLNKNIIIFAHNTEYINHLYTTFKERFPDKNVMKIVGSTTLKKRRAIINEMLDNNNCILIGSFGVVSTGLTFKNIDYGIFAQSFASDVITRQSLGRLMLRTAEKSEFYLYDIIDTYPTGKLYKQGLAKVRTYKKEGHRHTVETIKDKFVPCLPIKHTIE